MFNSIKKNIKGISIMAISSVFACVGQLLWKLSSQYGYAFLLAGFFCYGLGALLMIFAYRFGRLSVLQPVLSLNYVLSIVLAAVILKEAVTVTKVIGVVVISLGVILIAGGDSQ